MSHKIKIRLNVKNQVAPVQSPSPTPITKTPPRKKRPSSPPPPPEDSCVEEEAYYYVEPTQNICIGDDCFVEDCGTQDYRDTCDQECQIDRLRLTTTFAQACSGEEAFMDTCFNENPDFVLIWSSKNEEQMKEEAFKIREEYEYNLEEEGLQLDWDSYEELFVVKIWATIQVLMVYADAMGLKLSPRECVPNFRRLEEDKKFNPLKAVYSRKKCYLFDINETNWQEHFTPLIRARIVQHIMRNTAHKNCEEMEQKDSKYAFGYERLVKDNIYMTGYPLHEGSTEDAGSGNRKNLYDSWGNIKKLIGAQPLNEIKDYYGEEIALYFAFLRYYTVMLIYLVIAGIIFFICALIVAFWDASLEIDEFCEDLEDVIMCPECDHHCPFWHASHQCEDASTAHVLDTTPLVFFAFFLSVWCCLFLLFWKRREASIILNWDVVEQDTKLGSALRPEYVTFLKKEEAKPKPAKKKPNKAKDKKKKDGPDQENQEAEVQVEMEELPRLEPRVELHDSTVPYTARVPGICMSYCACFFLIFFVVTLLFGVVVIRFVTTDFMAKSHSQSAIEKAEGAQEEKEEDEPPPKENEETKKEPDSEFQFIPWWHKVVVSLIAAFLTLIIILIFGPIGRKLVLILTGLENRRTEAEFLSSYCSKLFFMLAVINYSALIYVAYFKGVYVGSPAEYYRLFDEFRQEDCLVNCLPDLSLTVAFLLIFLEIARLVGLIIFPLSGGSNSKSKNQKADEGETTGKGDEQWAKDYKLLDSSSGALFIHEAYLALVIQFGFLGIFGTGFPLAALILLITNAVRLRLQASGFLRRYRRPIGRRVNGMVIWYDYIDCLAKIAVVSNAVIIGVMSNIVPKYMFRHGYLERVTEEHRENGTVEGFLKYSLTEFAIEDLDDEPDDPVLHASEIITSDVCSYPGHRYSYNTPVGDDHKYHYDIEHYEIIFGRALFIILFVVLVAIVVQIVKWIVPPIPENVRDRMLREEQLLNDYIQINEVEMAKSQNVIRSMHARRKGINLPTPKADNKPPINQNAGIGASNNNNFYGQQEKWPRYSNNNNYTDGYNNP